MTGAMLQCRSCKRVFARGAPHACPEAAQPYTADNVTHEMIVTLRRSAGLSIADDESCRAAMDRRLSGANRKRHRARVAEILNVRVAAISDTACEECDGTGENDNLDHPTDKECLECNGTGRINA